MAQEDDVTPTPTDPPEPNDDPGNQDPPPEPDDDGKDDKADPEDAKSLGDAGKRAIAAMKRERNQARAEAEEFRKKVKEFEDKDKSESQRLQEAADEAKSRAGKAEVGYRKLQTAMDRAPDGASLTQIKAVAKRLSGETDEELETDADELFALLAPSTLDKDEANGKDAKGLKSKPRENLRGGGDPEQEPEETDPRKLAELIGRR